MSEKELNLGDSHKKLMELLVSRTLRKNGFKKESIDLSEREKEKSKGDHRIASRTSHSLLLTSRITLLNKTLIQTLMYMIGKSNLPPLSSCKFHKTKIRKKIKRLIEIIVQTSFLEPHILIGTQIKGG